MEPRPWCAGIRTQEEEETREDRGSTGTCGELISLHYFLTCKSANFKVVSGKRENSKSEGALRLEREEGTVQERDGAGRDRHGTALGSAADSEQGANEETRASQAGGLPGVSVRVLNQGQARGQIEKDPCKHYVATLGHC